MASSIDHNSFFSAHALEQARHDRQCQDDGEHQYFFASLLFGMAFIRTKSLAMPFGLHFMANWVQGGVLGFGVSGMQQARLFVPIFGEAPVWLTGGQFGLEASLPGLICVVIMLLMLYMKKLTTISR